MDNPEDTTLEEVFDDQSSAEEVTEEVTEDATEETGKEPSSEEETKEEAVKTEEKAKEEQTMVPVSVVQELRAEIRSLKNPEPKPEPEQVPDVIENPEEFAKHVVSKSEKAALNSRLDMSEQMAVDQYGAEKVKEAYEALKAAQDPATHQKILNEKHPYAALVKWHSQSKVINEIGDDPEAWKKAQRDIIRKELLAETEAETKKATAGKTVPSIAETFGTGGGQKSTYTGPTPLEDIFPE